jgi:DNA-binding MarR family transcriptional regulator
MADFNDLSEFLFENIKKVFFPEEWLDIDLKFSKSELFAMLIIDKRKEITMTELAEYIHSPMSTATGIIDRLVKGGYIRRDRSESDRRIVVLHLDEKGNNMITELKNVMSKYSNAIIEDLTQDEKQFLTEIIFKVVNRLKTKFTDVSKEKEIGSIKKIEIE